MRDVLASCSPRSYDISARLVCVMVQAALLFSLLYSALLAVRAGSSSQDALNPLCVCDTILPTMSPKGLVHAKGVKNN